MAWNLRQTQQGSLTHLWLEDAMPRELVRQLGRHPRRIALIAAVAIACASVAAHFLYRPRSEPPAPASIQAPTAETAPTAIPSPTDPQHSSSVTVAANPAPARRPFSVMPHGAAGMIVGIDPETGKLGLPSKADRAALASPAIDRSETGLTVVHKPDGSKMIDLQGRFQDYMIVHIGPDGRKVETCVQGSDAEAVKSASAPAPTPNAAPAER